MTLNIDESAFSNQKVDLKFANLIVLHWPCWAHYFPENLSLKQHTIHCLHLNSLIKIKKVLVPCAINFYFCGKYFIRFKVCRWKLSYLKSVLNLFEFYQAFKKKLLTKSLIIALLSFVRNLQNVGIFSLLDESLEKMFLFWFHQRYIVSFYSWQKFAETSRFLKIQSKPKIINYTIFIPNVTWFSQCHLVHIEIN